MLRSRPPWWGWTVEQWETYRDQQLAACERFGEPWVSNVGRACVAMAEFHLARLSATVPA